jgi:hypothetical protein
LSAASSSIESYLSRPETADRQEGELAEARSVWLKEKIAALQDPYALEIQRNAAPAR